MSTRAIIGLENKDGTFTGTWCWHDGHVEDLGLTLKEHFNSAEQVKELLDKTGNVSSIMTDAEYADYLNVCEENGYDAKKAIRLDGISDIVLVGATPLKAETYKDLNEAMGQDINNLFVFNQEDKMWMYANVYEKDERPELYAVPNREDLDKTYHLTNDLDIIEITPYVDSGNKSIRPDGLVFKIEAYNLNGKSFDECDQLLDLQEIENYTGKLVKDLGNYKNIEECIKVNDEKHNFNTYDVNIDEKIEAVNAVLEHLETKIPKGCISRESECYGCWLDVKEELETLKEFGDEEVMACETTMNGKPFTFYMEKSSSLDRIEYKLDLYYDTKSIEDAIAQEYAEPAPKTKGIEH